MKHTIWFDFTNVPHVNFLLPFIKELEKGNNIIYSVRDFAETVSLFEKRINKPYLLAGKHKGEIKIRKVLGVFERAAYLNRKLEKFDIKISVGGDSSNLVTKLRGRKSITFDDNETAPNWRYSYMSDFAFWPDAVDYKTLIRQGFRRSRLYMYNGYKEDIYLADYKPDPEFLQNLPFEKFVVVRAENIQANYVNTGKNSIVPELLRRFRERKINVLFLPRYKADRLYANGFSNVFIPDGAVNGLDACYYSQAILTGAGTMAREAACMGVPAVSFYSGKNLLAVDLKLKEKGLLFYSRNIDEIDRYLLSSHRKESDLERCRKVQADVKSRLLEAISKWL